MPASRFASLVVLASLVGVGLVACAPAAETPSPTAPASVASEPAPPVEAGEWEAYSGVARVQGGLACSGALIDTGVDSGPAYLITSGHCADAYYSSPNAVVEGGESSLTATFGLLAAGGEEPIELASASVVYSTMKGADVSVVELAATLGDAKALGLAAYPLAEAADGESVTNVGVPVGGLDEEEWVLRAGACSMGETVNLLEYTWHFDGAIATDCPGVLDGSSGSPLLTADGEIVGVVGTTTIGAPTIGGECYIGKPCERTADGVSVVRDRSYAASVAGTAACFGGDGVFALTDDCPLPRQQIVALAGGGYLDPAAIEAGDADSTVRVAAATDLSAMTALVSADVPEGCADASAYSSDEVAVPGVPDLLAAAFTDAGARLDADPAAEDGVWIFCVAVPGEEALASWTPFYIDGEPPAVDPLLIVNRAGDQVQVEPFFEVPELADFRIRWGEEGAVDCADTAAYEVYRRIPASVPTGELPITYCVMGATLAGVWGDPIQYTVTEDDVLVVGAVE